MTYKILLDQKKNLIEYIKSKIEAEDWHAVQDAASDIREINAKLMVLNFYNEDAKSGD